MAKSHCTCTCIKSSKEFACCVWNIARVHKCLILWRFEIWEKSNTLIHNHNCLMGTITLEVHLITPTSLRNTLATILKVLWFFLLLFSLHIFLLSRAYKREKNLPNHVNLKYHTFAMPKHTDVINDWQVLVVRWLFMHFSYDFLVIPIKNSDMSMRYKR